MLLSGIPSGGRSTVTILLQISCSIASGAHRLALDSFSLLLCDAEILRISV